MTDLTRLRALAGLQPNNPPEGSLREVAPGQYQTYMNGEWIEAKIDMIESDDDEAVNMSKHRALLEKYDEVNPQYVNITEIVVPTERDRQQLLAAIEYLHDNRSIDTEYYAVNSLVHVYERPELIKVKS